MVREIEGSLSQKNWWDDLKTIQEPYPHIPADQIEEAMPQELHESWRDFMRGQTGLLIEKDGEDPGFGVYPWDFERFVDKIKRGVPLVDTALEWD